MTISLTDKCWLFIITKIFWNGIKTNYYFLAKGRVEKIIQENWGNLTGKTEKSVGCHLNSSAKCRSNKYKN